MRGTWKEYYEDIENPGYWLKWGGIMHPQVLVNKDDSMLAVIAYDPYTKANEVVLQQLPVLCNGWAYWIETQHILQHSRDFLVIYWNPFLSGDTITNHVSGNISAKSAIDSFLDVVQDIFDKLFKITPCFILQYQALVSFLEASISINKPEILMPEVPLYMDALLTQDADIDFDKNEIFIGDKRIAVITLPVLETADENEIADFLETKSWNYRHVQRLLVFSQQLADKELNRYMRFWCSGRRSIAQLIKADIIDAINGYYLNAWIIPFDIDTYETDVSEVKSTLDRLRLSYIVEEYSCKEIWWASLPGMHEPYVQPPLVGFNNLDSLLSHRVKEDNRFV